MAAAGLPAPEFRTGDTFLVILRNTEEKTTEISSSRQERNILDFCITPKTRRQLADFLNIKSVSYAIKAHVTPLVDRGLLELEVPSRPRSPRQRYFTSSKGKEACNI